MSERENVNMEFIDQVVDEHYKKDNEPADNQTANCLAVYHVMGFLDDLNYEGGPEDTDMVRKHIDALIMMQRHVMEVYHGLRLIESHGGKSKEELH